MADTQNTEAPPAPEPTAPVNQATPAAGRRRWAMPLVSALVVVAALVVGGIGGYAIAVGTDAGGRPSLGQGQLPGGPGQPGPGQAGPRPDGPQQGPQGGPGGGRDERPDRQRGDGDGSTDSGGVTDDDETEG